MRTLLLAAIAVTAILAGGRAEAGLRTNTLGFQSPAAITILPASFRVVGGR
ncbi:MAG TPA: hypothetical protein VGM87_11965 [Roseomonas sp.]|jgi:hypothetical protein